MDMEDAMREAGIPLFSLESHRPLREFDFIGFSLQYELNYSNVLTMLDLAGVPLLASQRLGGSWPLIIGGGTCTYNPEPVSDFFDLFVIGEGEEVLLELVRVYADVGASNGACGSSREGFLELAAALGGVYVPSLYRVQYRTDGVVTSVEPARACAPDRIRKRIVPKLTPVPTKPVVPFVRAVHDRAVVEIMRGCTRGCRFCQAGMIYRPVRERSVQEVLQAVDELLSNTGYGEVGLASLSSTDYTCIEALVRQLSTRYADQRLSISLPSLRTDSFSVELAQIIQRSRKTGLTFAPEAGSERLRGVINKNVSDEDLLQTAEAAYESGWLGVKLYFMIGLPTETMDDVLTIVDLVKAVHRIGRGLRGRRAYVNVSVATFVPKPHTPFQWLPLADSEKVLARQRVLRDGLRLRGVHLSWSDEVTTQLEAAFSRGDRRMGRAVKMAWMLGARFDAWGEAFRPKVWQQAFADAELDLAFYSARERQFDEVLPWQHIDTGVSSAFLWDEYQRSLRGERSPDCRERCLDCGIRTTLGVERCPATVGSTDK
jgi:radical SAM family uncharacterized protein